MTILSIPPTRRFVLMVELWMSAMGGKRKLCWSGLIASLPLTQRSEKCRTKRQQADHGCRQRGREHRSCC